MTLMQPITPAATAGITCTVADLRRAVVAAASIVERRNPIPVLGCLRITPRDGLLTDDPDLTAVLMPIRVV